jgi:BirA family biotin operon repressor/biotin-[acetyl-CoA-carboxylase] ligase
MNPIHQRIIELLTKGSGRYVSGEQLSAQLNVSRTAIWKHIRNLKQQGYEIDAIPRRGYRILSSPAKIEPERLQSLLSTKTAGRTCVYETAVDSTQTVAHRLVAEGAGEGTLVIAEEQTAGRGRRGRSWHSPRGKGIWMSLVLKPDLPLYRTPQLTLLAAVAACRALRQETGVPVGIKWPNDLLVQGRKICGILLESQTEDHQLRYVVAGFGVSVNLEAGDYPPELRDKATSLLIESGKRQDRTACIAAILNEFERLYESYLQSGFEPIRTLWEALSVTLGSRVRIEQSAGTVEGLAEGLDESGALLVRTDDGQVHKMISGEIW